MLILKEDKSLLPRFILAKAVNIGKHAWTRRNYKRNLEIALIISLILMILLSRWSPHWKILKRYQYVEIEGFEVIDMPLVEEEIPPPPPPIAEQSSPDQIVVDEIQILKDDEPEPHPELDLQLEIDDKKILESQLDDDFRTKMTNYRNWQLSTNRLALADNYRNRTHDANRLEIGLKDKDKNSRRLRDSNNKLEIKLETETNEFHSPAEEEANISSSIIEPTDDVDVVILKPPKSSLALTEYQMWAKLSGEFDRIDKRHFNREFPNIKKTREGIQVAFRYRDGIQHLIYWQKGGKTSITVIGKNRKSSLEELKRALSALLQLTLNNY